MAGRRLVDIRGNRRSRSPGTEQRLTESWVLFGSVNAQFASKNLDSSERFSFGGPYGMRAYPIGEAPADAGVDADRRDPSTRFWLQFVKYWSS